MEPLLNTDDAWMPNRLRGVPRTMGHTGQEVPEQALNPGRVLVSGCPIDRLTLAEVVWRVEAAIRDGHHIRHCVVDAAQLAKMRHDPRLHEHVVTSDIINADGQSVVWLTRLYGNPVPERITSVDLMEALFRLAAERGYRAYLLGGTRHTIGAAAEAIVHKYGSAVLADARDGYFTLEQEESVLDKVTASGAQMLFVGLPTPREERFLFDHRDRLAVIPFATGVGGGFELLAGQVRRAPVWMRRLSLEWLHRFLQEPRRKWKSEVVDAASFYIELAAEHILGRRP